jgi:hypothetical protein
MLRRQVRDRSDGGRITHSELRPRYAKFCRHRATLWRVSSLEPTLAFRAPERRAVLVRRSM